LVVVGSTGNAEARVAAAVAVGPGVGVAGDADSVEDAVISGGVGAAAGLAVEQP
jgi:hypothetical protein